MNQEEAYPIVVVRPLIPAAAELVEFFRKDPFCKIVEVENAKLALPTILGFPRCLFISSIENNESLVSNIDLLKKLNLKQHRETIKAIVLGKQPFAQLVEVMRSLYVLDYITEPVSLRTLTFKGTLQLNTIKAQAKKSTGDSTTKIKADVLKNKIDATRINKISDPKQSAVQEDENIFTFKKKKVTRVKEKFLIEMEGPDPEEGDWEQTAGDETKPCWQWNPKNKQKKEGASLQIEGEQPVYNKEAKTWGVMADTPDASIQRKATAKTKENASEKNSLAKENARSSTVANSSYPEAEKKPSKPALEEDDKATVVESSSTKNAEANAKQSPANESKTKPDNNPLKASVKAETPKEQGSAAQILSEKEAEQKLKSSQEKKLPENEKTITPPQSQKEQLPAPLSAAKKEPAQHKKSDLKPSLAALKELAEKTFAANEEKQKKKISDLEAALNESQEAHERELKNKAAQKAALDAENAKKAVEASKAKIQAENAKKSIRASDADIEQVRQDLENLRPEKQKNAANSTDEKIKASEQEAKAAAEKAAREHADKLKALKANNSRDPKEKSAPEKESVAAKNSATSTDDPLEQEKTGKKAVEASTDAIAEDSDKNEEEPGSNNSRQRDLPENVPTIEESESEWADLRLLNGDKASNKLRASDADLAEEEIKWQSKNEKNSAKYFYKSKEEISRLPGKWVKTEAGFFFLKKDIENNKIGIIQEALPLWIYTGKEAPRFQSLSSRWQFLNIEPVFCTSTENLSQPILNELAKYLRKINTEKAGSSQAADLKKFFPSSDAQENRAAKEGQFTEELANDPEEISLEEAVAAAKKLKERTAGADSNGDLSKATEEHNKKSETPLSQNLKNSDENLRESKEEKRDRLERQMAAASEDLYPTEKKERADSSSEIEKGIEAALNSSKRRHKNGNVDETDDTEELLIAEKQADNRASDFANEETKREASTNGYEPEEVDAIDLSENAAEVQSKKHNRVAEDESRNSQLELDLATASGNSLESKATEDALSKLKTKEEKATKEKSKQVDLVPKKEKSRFEKIADLFGSGLKKQASTNTPENSESSDHEEPIAHTERKSVPSTDKRSARPVNASAATPPETPSLVANAPSPLVAPAESHAALSPALALGNALASIPAVSPFPGPASIIDLASSGSSSLDNIRNPALTLAQAMAKALNEVNKKKARPPSASHNQLAMELALVQISQRNLDFQRTTKIIKDYCGIHLPACETKILQKVNAQFVSFNDGHIQPIANEDMQRSLKESVAALRQVHSSDRTFWVWIKMKESGLTLSMEERQVIEKLGSAYPFLPGPTFTEGSNAQAA